MNPNTFVLKNLLKDEEVKRISKILLYFYFFFLIISNTFSQGLAGLLCIILIIRIGITGGRAYIATPFDLPFLVLIVCRFASTFFHYEPFQAIELVAKRLPLYGIYFVITNTVELDELPDEIERYIALIIYSCILGGLHGFYEFIFLKIVRPGSFAGGYSRLSEFSSVSIILAMFLRNNKKIFPDNWFYLTSFLIILGTLLITQSRAAWAGTGIALGILAIRGDRRYVFLFIAIFCIAVALVPSIRERAITIMDPIKNMSNRDVIWTDAIEKFKENPVLGYGIKSLKSILLPIAYLVTPNIYEAETLTGINIKTIDDLETSAIILSDLGAKNVLIKGGHMRESTGLPMGTDVLFDGKKFHMFYSNFVKTKNTHGIGCTLSAAITSNLALGKTLLKSVDGAKNYVLNSLKNSAKIGKGYSPVEQ